MFQFFVPSLLRITSFAYYLFKYWIYLNSGQFFLSKASSLAGFNGVFAAVVVADGEFVHV
jgi:hypothetical protein